MIEGNLHLTHGFACGGWLPHIVPQWAQQQQQSFGFLSPTVPPHSTPQDHFALQAFVAGMRYGGTASPNPSVGCVVVKDGQILASGCTRPWKDWHAEREAFATLDHQDLRGADVYVTLEPCTHTGYQPPCVELFKDRGIRRVYVSRTDPNPAVCGQGIRALESFGIDVHIGFLHKEVTAWNLPFFVQSQYKRPMIALKWAQSLDGCLADDASGSQWISTPVSRQYTHWLRRKYDAVMVGCHTFLTDTPQLDARLVESQTTRDPLRIIVDPKAQIALCSKDKQNMLKKKSFTKNLKTLFLIDENMIRDVLSSLSDWCAELRNSPHIMMLPIKKVHAAPPAGCLVESLQTEPVAAFLGRPLQSILVEGGGRTLGPFLQEKLFDMAHVFVAPLLVGGEKHRIAYPSTVLPRALRMHTLVQERFDQDVLMELVPDPVLNDFFL